MGQSLEIEVEVTSRDSEMDFWLAVFLSDVDYEDDWEITDVWCIAKGANRLSGETSTLEMLYRELLIDEGNISGIIYEEIEEALQNIEENKPEKVLDLNSF